MDTLKNEILEIIMDAYKDDCIYPDGPEIFKRLKRKGIVEYSSSEVVVAIDELEKSGQIARAPHYFVV